MGLEPVAQCKPEEGWRRDNEMAGEGLGRASRAITRSQFSFGVYCNDDSHNAFRFFDCLMGDMYL